MAEAKEESSPTTLDSNDKPLEQSEADSSVSLRYPILVCVIFSVLGVIYADTFFPELNTWRSLFAGFTFGLFCATCAATYSFLR